MLGSIPLFIASAKNKGHAAALSFKNEIVPIFYKKNLLTKSIPSLILK